jgi:hypothetical protein
MYLKHVYVVNKSNVNKLSKNSIVRVTDCALIWKYNHIFQAVSMDRISNVHIDKRVQKWHTKRDF